MPRFRQLLPEAADLEVDRYELENLLALNFVVHGLLGEGVASSTRPDPQAKSLGEYLRSRLVEVPVALLADIPAARRPEVTMDFSETDEQRMLREAVGGIAVEVRPQLLRRAGPQRGQHRRAVERAGGGRATSA